MNTRKHRTWLTASALALAALLVAVPTAQADSRHRDGPRRSYPATRSAPAHGRERVVVVKPQHDKRHNQVGVRVDFGKPVPTSRWVPGHYITETRTVLVEPGHYETRHIERVTQTYYPPCGEPYTVVIREGGYHQVWVPDRYETVATQVWVPGRWEPGPPVHHYRDSGVRVSIGGVFRF